MGDDKVATRVTIKSKNFIHKLHEIHSWNWTSARDKADVWHFFLLLLSNEISCCLLSGLFIYVNKFSFFNAFQCHSLSAGLFGSEKFLSGINGRKWNGCVRPQRLHYLIEVCDRILTKQKNFAIKIPSREVLGSRDVSKKNLRMKTRIERNDLAFYSLVSSCATVFRGKCFHEPYVNGFEGNDKGRWEKIEIKLIKEPIEVSEEFRRKFHGATFF